MSDVSQSDATCVVFPSVEMLRSKHHTQSRSSRVKEENPLDKLSKV